MTSITLPLAGRVVIDLSVGIAGAYATKLLVDSGAQIVKVEDPSGDPLRRWTASGAEFPADEDGALFCFLAGGKVSVVADAAFPADVAGVLDLVASADAVIWSRGSALAAHPSLSPEALRRSHPDVVVTTITPFGLEGPWADRPATDLTLQALSGGLIGLGRGRPDGPLVAVGGQISEWLSGVYAAVGTLVAIAHPVGDSSGDLVDLSMLEVVCSCLTYCPVTFFDMAGRPYREVRSVPSPGVEQASDGLVGLGTGTGQQWLDMCVMVGHPEWASDEERRRQRWRIAPEVAEWAAQHTVAEILDLATAFRIPHAPIGNGATLPVTDHFVARGSYVTNPRGDFVQPVSPVRGVPSMTRGPELAPRLGTDTGLTTRAAPERIGRSGRKLPLEGLRVLDLTAFWAGPACTQMMALLGAEVIHVESPTRPDGTRMLTGLPFTEDQWWEKSGIFAALNVNKLGITLDLALEAGREALRRLLATCDVLVENYTPRVLEQIGLGYDTVGELFPDLVMVRMPGFGLDGPWRDNPAFAFVVEDASGLSWLTGHPDDTPLSPYCVGDPAAGVHALFGALVALEHRRRTGQGALVEAAMIDTAINLSAEQVIEHSAYGALLGRDGNRSPAAAPQNCYRTADPDDGMGSGWVAISVATDAQWRALCDMLGSPEWALDPTLETRAGRQTRHDEIDAHLAAWCGLRSGEHIIDTLVAAGVPVARVRQPHHQADLEQLTLRGYFKSFDHPVTGSARLSTLPFHLELEPAAGGLRRAPLFGEHTDDVLLGAGHTPEDLEALAAARVIARSPLT